MRTKQHQTFNLETKQKYSTSDEFQESVKGVNKGSTIESSKVFKDKSFWYYLRRYKKMLRNSYQKDLQEAYERGLRVQDESGQVKKKMDERFMNGYAIGVHKTLMKLNAPSIVSEELSVAVI
eukprot:TRINITY_DN5864_c0_g1_i2.p1 TRINITY_DN5864_c0_g1~~TRINITY_DN5864_c0_g1_i2.p1  ORF type:complete len:139 (+),score=14.66 TRINITY_DN5864_c0_g1_i2:53-418(+)